MSRFACHHELVETGKVGEVPTYKCRLCGATLHGRKPQTRTRRLVRYWILAIGYLGMSSSVFFALALPGFTRGEVCVPSRFGPENWIHRNQSPGSFWSLMMFYVGFSVATLAVSVWEFRNIRRELRGSEHVA
jgi:hypothetical protein